MKANVVWLLKIDCLKPKQSQLKRNEERIEKGKEKMDGGYCKWQVIEVIATINHLRQSYQPPRPTI